MPDLISAGQKAQVFAALKGVTDTFYKTPVKYVGKTPALDRFREGAIAKTESPDGEEYFMSRVTTSGKDKKDIDEKTVGALDITGIEIRINAADVDAAGFIADTKECTFDITAGAFLFAGLEWKLTGLSYDDSNFMGDYVLVVCHCSKIQKKV